MAIPAVHDIVSLNQNYRTFYGNEVNGNVTVMNFRGNFTKEQVQQISNTMSKELKSKMKAPNMNALVSVGVKFPFGYKSSTHLTELGADANIWDPYEYDPDEHVMKNYNNSNLRIQSFDIYLMMRPTAGGCAGKYNDCLYDCLKVLTNGKLPEKINHPRKLKRFFNVGRTDCIDINSPQMVELEKLMGNCNINIGGDHQYTSRQPDDRYFKYYINLKGKHYSPKHVPKRQILGYFQDEKPPMIFKVDGDNVQTFAGDTVKTMPKTEWKALKKDYVMIPKEDLSLEDTYLEFSEGALKLKEITKSHVYQINMFKTGDLKNTVKQLFNHFTYGIAEPDEIDEFEGNLLKKANRGGLQFAVPYSGECWKYDFVSRYPSIMCSTKCIPVKKGKFITMTQEGMDIKIKCKHTPKYGIYNCKISKSNSNSKYFGFIKSHQYTHEDIELAILLGLKIEMINKENNAYVYEKDALVPMCRIFKDYIDYCFELRNQKAPFAKMFLSMLWGVLSTANTHSRIISADAEPIVIDENYMEQSFTRLDNNKFQINYGDTGNVYVYNWARLGTFLTSMARNKLAKFLLPRKDDVVYCHTDGFILKNKLETDREFTNDLHGLKYEGHNKNIKIINMRNIENNNKNDFLKI